MELNRTSAMVLAATAADGLLAGASLDQSLKQLPARRRIGVVPYSSYSRASDLGNGIAFYGILGVGAAALTIRRRCRHTATSHGRNALRPSTRPRD